MKTNNGSRKRRNNQPRKPKKTDRISDLPDAILITILSLLPINTAASTSVLSRRWRYIWCYITRVILPPNLPNFLDFNYLVSTVDHIMPQIMSPKIDIFGLVYKNLPRVEDGGDWNPAVYANFLMLWFQLLCVRFPEFVKVDFRKQFLNPLFSFNLSTYIFNTPSLVYLKLYVDFKFDGDVLSLINLPNLKKLRIILGDHNRDVLGLLFQSCPLLEDLKLILRLIEDDHFIDISAPNLKRLMIRLEANIFENVTDTCRIYINTPMLEYFNIYEYLTFFEFFGCLKNLKKVILHIIEAFNHNDFTSFESKLLSLFRGICSTRSLIFENCGSSKGILDDYINFGTDNWPPVFPNLSYVSFYNTTSEDTFPRVLLPELKVLEIHNVDLDELEIQMIEDILSKAPVIEKLKVFLHPRCPYVASDYAGRLAEECEKCTKIFMLPRISSNCEIGYYGRLMGASSRLTLSIE